MSASTYPGEMLSWRRTLSHRRVIVNLVPTIGQRGERAFDAVFWAKRGSILILKDAKLIETGAEPRKVDGEVIIERSRVEFIQVPPEA